ncbi:hypothetical protein [Aureivirga sp. CE67]|uniref:hypothetical protein n=1 Tax=Aureivirga sp. CE67 TaxID=1788983 RepID=UPI0018CBA7A8|nr:hypothetical protein [Aureivirga sp. CE67]
MKRIFILFLLLSTSILSAQINKSDLNHVNKLVSEFDVVLKKYYPNAKDDLAYKEFMTELVERKVNPNIINETNSLSTLQKFTKNESFKKIWILNPAKDKSKKYAIDFNGDFYNYIIKNCKNKDVKTTLTEFQRINNDTSLPEKPSPYLLARAFTSFLKDNEYSQKNIKEAIAILFYYDIMCEHRIK